MLLRPATCVGTRLGLGISCKRPYATANWKLKVTKKKQKQAREIRAERAMPPHQHLSPPPTPSNNQKKSKQNGNGHMPLARFLGAPRGSGADTRNTITAGGGTSLEEVVGPSPAPDESSTDTDAGIPLFDRALWDAWAPRTEWESPKSKHEAVVELPRQPTTREAPPHAQIPPSLLLSPFSPTLPDHAAIPLPASHPQSITPLKSPPHLQSTLPTTIYPSTKAPSPFAPHAKRVSLAKVLEKMRRGAFVRRRADVRAGEGRGEGVGKGRGRWNLDEEIPEYRLGAGMVEEEGESKPLRTPATRTLNALHVRGRHFLAHGDVRKVLVLAPDAHWAHFASSLLSAPLAAETNTNTGSGEEPKSEQTASEEMDLHARLGVGAEDLTSPTRQHKKAGEVMDLRARLGLGPEELTTAPEESTTATSTPDKEKGESASARMVNLRARLGLWAGDGTSTAPPPSTAPTEERDDRLVLALNPEGADAPPPMRDVRWVEGDVFEPECGARIDAALAPHPSRSPPPSPEPTETETETETDPRKLDVVLCDLGADQEDWGEGRLEQVGKSLRACRAVWALIQTRLRTESDAGRRDAGVLVYVLLLSLPL
ncbi:hypothetical protein DXG01_008854 [Tephrocybe rancida]|nr:hypothetical protein DXG01_008854 [Tephrocybe rancida]